MHVLFDQPGGLSLLAPAEPCLRRWGLGHGCPGLAILPIPNAVRIAGTANEARSPSKAAKVLSRAKTAGLSPRTLRA